MKKLYHYKFSPWTVKGDKRIVASESAWKKPAKWNKEAAAQEERPRVLVPVDVFEDWQGPMRNVAGDPLFRDTLKDAPWTDGNSSEPGAFSSLTMSDVRRRLFSIIDATPHLDWLLVTERPENVTAMMPAATSVHHDFMGRKGLTLKENGPLCVRKNLWLGVSVENQKQADKRVPPLLLTPTAVRFLWITPSETIDLDKWLDEIGPSWRFSDDELNCCWPGIDLVIVSGESGPRSRPCDLAWIRSIVQQCKAAGVPVFVKQLGSHPVSPQFAMTSGADWDSGAAVDRSFIAAMKDKKGGAPSEWPADLRVRELPGGQS